MYGYKTFLHKDIRYLILKFQGWTEFVSEYRVYYPWLVSEFFQNLETNEKKTKLWSTVKGLKIKISGRMIRKTLQLPEGDVDEWILNYDPSGAYTLMTKLPATSDPKMLLLTSFNTNSSSPLQRLLHHMFTTIITPQGGGRCTLTETQKFLFYYLFKNIQVNLSSVMMNMLSKCLDNHIDSNRMQLI